MSTSLESETTEFVSIWWLRFVRTVSLSSLLSILVPWYAAIFRDLNRHDRYDLFWPVLFCPLWLPYLWVLWALRPNTGTHAVKKALATALGSSSLILFLFSFLLALTSFGADRPEAIVYALVVLLQAALLLGTVKAYYSMEREPGDVRILTTRLWVPFVGIAAVAIILPNLFFLQERIPYEASSIGSLRTVNTAQFEYAQTNPDRGFASSLAELGPGSGDLIDSVLASGNKSGYVFILTAAPPDSHGRIVRYSVTARPQRYGKNKHSFFTDESGILRFTTEDRAATAEDPILQ